MKKETREQLELFRRQQEEVERRTLEDESVEAPKEDKVQWAAPVRKRKKGPESGLLKGVKLRKASSASEEKKSLETDTSKEKATASATIKEGVSSIPEPTNTTNSKLSAASPPTKAPNTLSLGLGYASSGDDD